MWYSFFGVAVSIYYLKFDNDVGSNDLAGISWVVYSVLVLVIAGFIKGLSFKERASLIKECYESLKYLYARTKEEDQSIDLLTKEYEQILSACENHTDNDYYQALCETYITHSKENMKNLYPLPTWFHYYSVVWANVKRFAMLSFFYLLPIILFCVLGKFK